MNTTRATLKVVSVARFARPTLVSTITEGQINDAINKHQQIVFNTRDMV